MSFIYVLFASMYVAGSSKKGLRSSTVQLISVMPLIIFIILIHVNGNDDQKMN